MPFHPKALSELGLIAFIGNKTADLIKDVSPLPHHACVARFIAWLTPVPSPQVPEDSRLTVGMLLILWISALAS